MFLSNFLLIHNLNSDTFKLDEIVEAHKVMNSNFVGGKIVVVT